MALPDFKKIEQDKNVIPDWAKYMKDGEFISYSTTYPTRKYLSLFDKYSYPCNDTGEITYYVYNPVKHGADPSGTYPVTMWLHGASNSLMGDGCIMCCGAEQYASPKYQQEMGGAYIIVPLANEEHTEEGQILNGWGKVYAAPVKAIYDKVCEEHAANIGKSLLWVHHQADISHGSCLKIMEIILTEQFRFLRVICHHMKHLTAFPKAE